MLKFPAMLRVPQRAWLFFLFTMQIYLCAVSTFAAERGTIAGTPTANLRVGPSTEQAIIITLKEGDVVTVEKLEGEWYQVTAAEGQKGFIHKNLIKIAEAQKAPVAPVEAKAQSAQPSTSVSPTRGVDKTPHAAVPTSSVTAKSTSDKPIARTGSLSNSEGKSTGLIQLIDGRETEAAVAAGIAVLFFVFGWICGGVYSLRRDRLKRSRLVF